MATIKTKYDIGDRIYSFKCGVEYHTIIGMHIICDCSQIDITNGEDVEDRVRISYKIKDEDGNTYDESEIDMENEFFESIEDMQHFFAEAIEDLKERL